MSNTAASSSGKASQEEGPLWLALRFPEAWFESRCPEEERLASPPVALLERRPGMPCVKAVNVVAARYGVRPGQTRLAAQSRFRDAASAGTPELRFLEPDETAVARWLEGLGETAMQYTSRVCRPKAEVAPGLLLEIGRSAALFHGLEELLDRVLHEFRSQGLFVRSAMAPHPRIAWALARGSGEQDGYVRDRRRQIEAVCHLPLATLDWPADWILRFTEMGLSTLGELRRLPRDGVAMRSSPRLLEDVDRLFAERDWQLPGITPPARFEREIDLWDPAVGVERLLLLSRRLLVELANFLRRRQLALDAFGITLCHESDAPTRLEVRTAEGGRDERIWMEQLRLRLQAFTDLTPVTRIQMQAERFIRPSPGQVALFEEAADRERNEVSLWHRLAARLGDRAVSRVQTSPAVIPSRQSCRLAPAGRKAGQKDGAGETGPRPDRPFWWLESPAAVRGRVDRWGETERIQTIWWETVPETADYRPADLADGRSVWLRRELTEERWMLSGLGG
ncbi:Y-family DNA polymerase [Guyparkeria sp.]|uniref:Y-family DNA polymerase n=1 Tax=Guyparkeria sp. TaxID=2035736 RepID=UPI003564B865